MAAIHHITAVGRDMDFYKNTLDLKLVKKTVNFDDPYTYHIYFGDEIGRPGTALTFFLWDMPPARQGIGQVSAIAYEAADLASWEKLLKAYRPVRLKRFGDDILQFTDPNGMLIELVDKGRQELARFYGATINVLALEKGVLEALGFRPVAREGSIIRFKGEDVLDVMISPDEPPAVLGIGSVHHIAFRAKDKDEQLKYRKKLLGLGLNVTPVIDRKYFESIYFRLTSGVLFEIATDGPGFLVDETMDELGKSLMLPEQYENMRKDIEKRLPPI